MPIAIKFNDIDANTKVRVNGVEVECTGRYDVPPYDSDDGLATVVACAPGGSEPQTVVVEVQTNFATMTTMVDIPSVDEPTDPPTTTTPGDRSASPAPSDDPTPP